jgi:hypothetical protein
MKLNRKRQHEGASQFACFNFGTLTGANSLLHHLAKLRLFQRPLLELVANGGHQGAQALDLLLVGNPLLGVFLGLAKQLLRKAKEANGSESNRTNLKLGRPRKGHLEKSSPRRATTRTKAATTHTEQPSETSLIRLVERVQGSDKMGSIIPFVALV